jgi:outer membrane beta-barrel protein
MRAFLIASLICGAAAAQQADPEPVRVHVLERRPFTEAGRWELTGFLPVQVNSKFTFHAGMAAEVAYHLRENLAAQIGIGWMPIAHNSSFTEELVNKVHQQPQAANALLLQGDALAGLELMPVYGKLTVFDGKILRLGFYLNAGVGAAKTQLQLRASGSEGGRSFGDTGFRPMGGLGAGFRVFIGQSMTVRLELRDLVYSAYVSRVNGCSAADANAIKTSGRSASVSGGCDIGAFGGSETDVRNNAAIAADALRDPSADVINHIAFFGGISYLF